jgi:hypothetical protein
MCEQLELPLDYPNTNKTYRVTMKFVYQWPSSREEIISTKAYFELPENLDIKQKMNVMKYMRKRAFNMILSKYAISTPSDLDSDRLVIVSKQFYAIPDKFKDRYSAELIQP